MLPVWTKCLFCGWAPVARLEFILGPMANQTLHAHRRGHDDRLGRRQHGRARRPGGLAQARRHSQGRRRTTSSPTSARRTAIYVNGHKVPKKTLEPGDIIRVGNTEAVFKRE